MSGILGGIAGNLAGGNIGRAVVSLVLDTTGYNSQLQKAKGETEASSTGMAGSFDRFKIAAVASAAVAGAAVVDFAKESISAAIDANEQQLKLANAIQNSGLSASQAIPAFQAQAQALRDLTGVDDDVINAGQSILVNMGLQQDQVSKLTPLVVDLSEKYGIDLNSAFKAVGKAVEGNTGGLARFIGPVEAGSTAAETYANVLEKLGAVQGFAASKAKAEPWILLRAEFEQLQEDVGQQLLPALQQVTPALEDILKALEPLITAMAGQFGQELTDVTTAVAALGDAATQLSGAIDSVSGSTDAGSGAFHLLSEAVQSGLNPIGSFIHNAEQAAGFGKDAADATDDWGQAAADATSNWTNAGNAQDALARKTREATAAMKAQRLEQLQAAGGLLGLVSALQQARQDQSDLNKLQREGKKGTQEYRDAVIQATTDQLAFRTAVRQYVADNPNRSLSQTRDVLREMAQQAGITGQQFRSALGGPLKEIIGSLDNLQSKRVSIQVDSSQLSLAEARADRLLQQLNRAGV